MSASYDMPPPLPYAERPQGAAYFLGTWTGRILIVNAIVFVALCIVSGSIMMPDTQTLLSFGAKDPAGLARGEYWRLVTPMFIHIGVIHFAVNSYMLYVIGHQLEQLIGGRWYLATYLAAGIAGNIASAVFSVQMSAGASGALFGLLGCGFYLERTIGKRIEEMTGRRPKRVYAATVALNLVLGLMIPFIDNAAHVGGLITGVVMTIAMMNLRPNQLRPPRKAVGIGLLIFGSVVLAVGARLGTSEEYLYDSVVGAAQKASQPQEKLYHLTQALTIRPKDPVTRLERARVLFLSRESSYALYDVREALSDGIARDRVEELAKELESSGFATDAWQVRRLAAHGAVVP